MTTRRSVGPLARVVVIIALVVIAVLASAFGFILGDLRHNAIRHARVEGAGVARVVAEQTARAVEGVVLVLRGTRERLTDSIGLTLALDSFPVHLMLRTRVTGLPQVAAVFVVDHDGRVVNSSRPDFAPGLAVADRDYFRHFAAGSKDEIFIGELQASRLDGKRLFFISTRLVDGAGRFRGVAVASVSVDYFATLFEGLSFEYISGLQLLGRDGAGLAGRAPAGGWGSELAAVSGGGEATAGQARLAVVRHGEEGERYLAFQGVAGYPLVIATSIEEQDVLEPWRQTARPVALATALLVLFLALVTWQAVRSLHQRAQLESALNEREERLRQIVESVSDAIVAIDAGRRVILLNAAAERLFGVASASVLGEPLSRLLAPCLPGGELEALCTLVERVAGAPELAPQLGNAELLREGGSVPVEFSLSATPFRGQGFLTVVFRDLTDRQRAQRELLESNRQLQELSAALQNVREEERARISRELHDELGQALTGIRLELSWLGGRLAGQQLGLADKVVAIKGLIDQTIASVRRLSSELRPLVLDDLGFAAAASWYVDQYSGRTGLRVQLDLAKTCPPEGSAVATALFRILQEALTNVARHAEATQVEIRLAEDRGNWLFSIRDDGRGFADKEERRSGIGLVSMRERVQFLRGKFSLTMAPGGGTLVQVEIPVEQRAGDDNAQDRGVAGG